MNREERPGWLRTPGRLGEPVRRRLYEYVSGQDQPVSRGQAAAAAGMGRTLAAYHLGKLAAAGLLETACQPLAGRGGPGAATTEAPARPSPSPASCFLQAFL